jgi:hypothetical protein
MADAADLYGLPLESFTAERDAAARELRRAGDREAAARLGKLPKPTPAAWAANQVAREQPDVLQGFLEAGAALRAAQEDALAGRDTDLRAATRAQRSAVDAFMAAAEPLRPGGRPLSRAMADRLRTTLMAAAGNEALSEALAEGRLAMEAEAAGAWPPDDPQSIAAAEAARAARPRVKEKPAKKEPKRRAKPARQDKTAELQAAEREERERAEAERERLKAERQELDRELRELRGTLKVRQRGLVAAEKDAQRARKRLEALLAEAEDARVEAEAMEQVLAEARDAVGSARDDVARLEERLD